MENILEIKVDEEVALKDVPPGTPKAPHDEKLPKEEKEKRQKIINEYSRLQGRYCSPHTKMARWIKATDVGRVMKEGLDMVTMCGLPRGKYSGIAALAHPQIEEKDPLRFFVLPTGLIVINPIIFNHTKTEIGKAEGSMSHPDKSVKKDVPRYNKIMVVYQSLTKKNAEAEPTLSKPITESINGWRCHVFQHEISQLHGADIYDEKFKASSCEGIGKGPMTEEEARKLFV